ESGGVVRNVFENCAGGGVNFPVESQFLLDSIPQKSEGKGLYGSPRYSVHFTANYWRFHEIDFIEARGQRRE
ncbi:MAG: hypothetical protein DMG38_01690, partial [Acidobacteria bacterium]